MITGTTAARTAALAGQMITAGKMPAANLITSHQPRHHPYPGPRRRPGR